MTFSDIQLLLGDRVTLKIRIRPVNGKPLCEVEVHEDCDGFGVNASAVHEDLEKAVRLAIQDLDDSIEEERAAERRTA